MLLCGYSGFFWHIVGLHLVGIESVEPLLAMAEDAPASRGRALACFTKGMVHANTGEPEQTLATWSQTIEDGQAIGDETLVALGHGTTGYMLIGLGRIEEAAPHFEKAIERARATGYDFLLGLCLTFSGMRSYLAGDADGGTAMVRSAREMQVRMGDYEGGGISLSFLAQMKFTAGDYGEAMALYDQALDSFGVVGDKPEIARVHCEMGYTGLAAEDLPEARTSFQRALRTYDEVGSPRGTGQALLGLAATEAAAGDTEQAVTIAVAAQALSDRIGVVVEHAMAPGMAERIEAIRASIPQSHLQELVASGSSLSPAEVLEMVES